MEEKGAKSRQHKMRLSERKQLEVEGVDEVMLFDPQQVVLSTSAGKLMIRGSDLHVSGLSVETGLLSVDGQIDSLTYSEKGSKRGSILKKLLR